MTINSDLSRARYVGNGVTATFAIPFAYLTNSDGTAQVAVYVGDSDVALVEGKDYTVKGFGKYSDASDQIDEDLITYETRYENGEFTLVNVPGLGQAVAVIRDVPQTQGIVFVEGEKFPAQDFENGLDKLTMEVQEVKENLTRAIVLPPTSTDNPLEIRGDILKAANEAKTTAETAIILVKGAPEVIASETDKAVNTIGNFTDEKTAAFNELVKTKEEGFLTFVETKTEEFEQTAITATEQAVGSAERSRIWAEGEQAEVEPLGGTLSSMGAADLAYAIANAPEDVPVDASGLKILNVIKGEKGDKGDKGEDGKDGGGLEIGDVAFAVMGIDETKNLRRYLNGQVISQTQFVSFANWVKERAKLYPNTVVTEENWQAEVTNSKLGQCGKFVIDDVLGTIRLPKVVNINGLQDLALMGSIKAESLPNIAGNTGMNYGGDWGPSGAFYVADGTDSRYGGTSGTTRRVAFDASLSSSTYQDNAPVQQEAIQYPYFIQVATGVEESVDVTREIELNNPFSLLDYKYSEYEISNASWLLSNGQWNSGAVYQSVYDLLLQELNGTSSKLPYRSYVNTLGNLVNTDGVLSGFSASNYAEFPEIFDTGDNPWEVVFKVKTGASISSGEAILSDGIGAAYNGLYIIIYNGKWGLGISSNGTTWDIADASREIGQISAVANTDCYVRASWDGSQYKLDVSTDGLSYQNSVTVNSTTKKIAKLQSIGCAAVNANFQFNGTIDLNESYININGKRWWTGRRKIVTSAGDYADTDFVLNTVDTTFRLPVKVKLASGNAVVGNGMTLGLTNGMNNTSLQAGGSGIMYNDIPGYGKNVGVDLTGGTAITNDTAIGVTTDPTKSGIETSSTGLYLYFYVGETIQDANVIAASQVLTKVANSVDKTSATDRETVVGWGMPDYSAGIDIKSNLTVGAIFTVPYDCMFYILSIGSNSGFISFKLNNDNGPEIVRFASGTVAVGAVDRPYFKKGTKLYISGLANLSSAFIYPLEGVN